MSEAENTFKFAVDLLFSEPLHFDLAEIVEAVNEDYPGCEVAVSPMNPETMIKTDDVAFGVLDPKDARNGSAITFIGAGFPDEGFRNGDHMELAWKSTGFEQAGLDAIKAHQSYINVAITPVDDSLAARFLAARQLSAVVAVFAKLPVTLAVFPAWASRLVAPQKWVAGTESALKGEWPLTEWISYRAGWDNEAPEPQTFSVGYTTGVSAFTGYEIYMQPAPIQPSDTQQMLGMASWLPLQGGNVFSDGDTLGLEEGVEKYRIRQNRMPDGSPNPHVLSLIHPGSRIDEVAMFGPNPLQPTPEGVDNSVRPKKSFMQRLLGRN